jgi:hypothetical protein
MNHLKVFFDTLVTNRPTTQLRTPEDLNPEMLVALASNESEIMQDCQSVGNT